MNMNRGKPFKTLQATEWSEEFEAYMRNRLLVGAYRYGAMNHPGKPGYDRIGAALKRLQEYQQCKNKELLVDVANLCLLEFVEGEGKFLSNDDSNEHVKIE